MEPESAIVKKSLPPDAVKSQTLKDDKFDEERSYEVNFQIHRCLTTYVEPDDYIVDVSGNIICNYERSGDSIAGTIQGYIILVDRIINDHESLFDACDLKNQTVHDYGCVLFNFRTGELKRSIEKQFDVVGAGDVLILDRIEVLPEHRGRGLGLAAACCFLDTFETGCCLAVGEPYPIQFKDMTPDHTEWCSKMAVDRFVTDEKLAMAKLMAYWGRLGFKQIRGSRKFALSLQHARPKLADLVAEL